MASNDVMIRLVADISSLQSELKNVKKHLGDVEKNSSSATEKMKSSFKKVAGVVGTAFAVGKVVGFGKECIDLAANVEEMENKFNVVFKTTGKQMDEWSDTFAKAIGRSKTEIKTGVSNLGDLLTGYGMAEQSAGELSKQVIALSYDLASFNNVQDSEAIEKMTKGILGEHEGLKSLGIVINDTTTKQKMMEMGLTGQFSALDEVTKAEVRYQIMLDQTKNAQGDAERSADSYTNKQKALQAQIESLKESIGTKLLPIMTDLTLAIFDLVDTASPYILAFVDGIMLGFTSLYEITKPIIDELFTFIRDIIASTMDGSNGLLESFRLCFEEVWAFCLQIWNDVGKPVFDVAKEHVKILVDFFVQNYPTIQNVVKTAWDIIKKVWETVGKPCFDIIMSMVKRVQETFKEHMPKISAFFKDVVSTISTQWNKNLKPVFEQIKKFIENVLKPAFEFVFDKVIKPLVETVFKNIGKYWTGILKPVFEGICEFLSGVFTGNWRKVWEGLGKIVSGVFNGLTGVVKKPINAIIDMVNSMISGLNKIKVPDWVPGVGGKGVNIGKIPRLATGGIAVKSTIANIGEAGTEAIVPLSNKSRMKPFAEAVASMMPNNITGEYDSSSGVSIQINGLSVREEADVKKIAEELYKIQDRNRRRRGVVYA